MRDELEVRDASPEEAGRVLDLVRTAYAEFQKEMEPAAWSGLERAILRVLGSPLNAEQIVAVAGDRLVGSVLLYAAGADAYAGATPPLPWPEVRLLAVAPEARGAGVASVLMKECIHRAARQGAEWIGIHTSRSMRAAREMYRRMGFTRRPEFDFQPPGAELVEAYVLDIRGPASRPEE